MGEGLYMDTTPDDDDPEADRKADVIRGSISF